MSNNAPPPAPTSFTSLDDFAAQSLGASLTVRDLAASAAWYRDVLGFTIDREYRRDAQIFAVAVRAGHVRLLLTQDTGAQGHDREKGEGFSLLLTTEQDVDALAAQIRARGGVLASEPADVFGTRAFRLRDPDGFRFAISAPRAG
ncbi:MAG: VOC family protein [Gemmatimonadaceae bacterium]